MNKKRTLGKRIGRGFLWLAGLLILLVALAYGATRPPFLRRMVLPRIAAAMEATLEVDSLRLRPFSRLELEGVRFRKLDGSTEAEVERVDVHYSLVDILRGTMTVDLARMDAPRVVVRPEEASELEEKPPRESREDPVRLNIREVRITRGELEVISPEQTLKVSEVEVDVRNVVTGQLSDLTFSAALSVLVGEADELDVALSGEGSFRLSPFLAPEEATLRALATVERTAGAFAEAAEVREVGLGADLTPGELRSAELAFRNPAGETLGRAHLAGPFDPEALSADLRLQVEEVGAPVLNLVGAAHGWSFGDTRLAADVQVKFTEGRELESSGEVTGGEVSLSREGFTTPVVSFRVRQRVAADFAAQSAHLQEMEGRVLDQDAREMVSLQLSRSTRIRWDGERPEVEDVELTLGVDHLELADWRALLGPEILGGRLKGNAEVRVAEMGKDLRLTAETELRELALEMDGQRLEGFTVALNGGFRLANFETMDLEKTRLRVDRGGVSVAAADLSGRAGLDNGAVDLETRLRLMLPEVVALLPAPIEGLELRAGQLTGTATVKREGRGAATRVESGFALASLAGKAGELTLDGLGLRSRIVGEHDAEWVRLEEGTLSAQRNGEAMAQIRGHGRFHQETREVRDARVTLEHLDLPMLAGFADELPFTVVSGVVSGEVKPEPFVARGPISLRTPVQVHVADLLVRNEQTPADTPAQTLQLQFEAEMGENRGTMRDGGLQWTSVERAANLIAFAGEADWSNPEAIHAHVEAEAEALDLTPWMRMFVGEKKEALGEPPPPVTGPTEEPAARRLPLEEAWASLRVGRLYVDHLVAEGLDARLTAGPERVEWRPFRLMLNGSEIRWEGWADLNVPGFRYEMDARVEPLDLAPVLSALAPALADHFEGILEVTAQLQGQGITGPSLREHLVGEFHLLLTESSIDWQDLDHTGNRGIINVRDLVVLVIWAAAPVLRIPPGDLLNPPIHELRSDLRIAQGRLNVETFRVVNESFRLTASGEMVLENDLEASRIRDIPVVMGLNTNIAKRARLYREDRVKEDMVDLPPFIRVRGTLGNPDLNVRAGVITGMVLDGVTGEGVIGDERTRRVLEGLGGILTGEGPRPTPTPTPTPAPAPEETEEEDEAPPAPTPTPRPTPRERLLRELEGLL